MKKILLSDKVTAPEIDVYSTDKDTKKQIKIIKSISKILKSNTLKNSAKIKMLDSELNKFIISKEQSKASNSGEISHTPIEVIKTKELFDNQSDTDSENSFKSTFNVSKVKKKLNFNKKSPQISDNQPKSDTDSENSFKSTFSNVSTVKKKLNFNKKSPQISDSQTTSDNDSLLTFNQATVVKNKKNPQKHQFKSPVNILPKTSSLNSKISAPLKLKKRGRLENWHIPSRIQRPKKTLNG